MTDFHRSAGLRINDLKDTIPQIVMEKHLEVIPALKSKYGPYEKSHYIEDTRFHINYLSEAIASREKRLFTEYMGWAKTFYSRLPINESDIILNLELLREALIGNLDKETAELVTEFMNDGIQRYKTETPGIPSYISEDNPLAYLASAFLGYLIKGDKDSAQEIILKAMENGTTIKEIYLHVFQITQRETGRLWQTGEITVAHEHFITAATQTIMSRLYPYLFSGSKKGKKIIVACTAGEMHEMGARMVADIFELNGWNSFYFGSNTPKHSLIDSIKMHRPDIIALSVTMVYHISEMTEVIDILKKDPLTEDIKIIAGGYPFLLVENLWQKVDADGSAVDAVSAVELAENLTSGAVN